jgi:conjugative relaxase-like TrwC/TraI family protein
VAVVATLSKGYDLEYIWEQVDCGPAKDAAGYYIQASETGGEPPGRWWGPGAKALGLEPGQVVEREAYDLLFGQRKAPDGTQLGRPPGNGRKAADLYARLLAAEPHATAGRKHELRVEATRQARQGPLFFDLAISLSKSMSIFHASLGENVRLAREAGDLAGEGYWSGLVAEVDDMIWQAVRAGFDYFQREAGYTRTGSHNTRVHGRETGQWHEADLAVAHWLQHTSRDGDMQLHVHSQIAHTAKTVTDGKWRAPDSLGYNEDIGAVAAIVSQHLEEALTRRFGLAWEARDDGHGFEIRGISGEMMRLFSSRRQSITADLRARAARFEAQYGRAPSQRELARLAQASNFATRAAKTGTLDVAQVHAGWADTLERTLGVSLASVAPSVWHDGGGHAGARPRGPGDPGRVPGQLEVSRAAQKAVALAQQEKSTWTRADLIKYLGRVLPRSGMDPAAAAALLGDLADRALRSEFEPVACLEAPEPVEVPVSLRRADGRSVYQRHGGVRFATHAQLSMEQRMLALARAGGAPRMDRVDAARALGADLAQLERALADGAPDAHGQRTRTGLRVDQAAAALSVLTDGRRVSVLNAPAGSGKTWVLTAAGQAWAAAGLGRVIGITPSQSARNTLAARVPESYNTAQFLGHLPGQRGARGPVQLRPGDVVLMDEASMVANPDMADVIAQAAARGPGRPRPGRRARRARHARREAAAPARHLPDRDRLGTAMGGRCAPPGPRRRPRGPPSRPACQRRSRSRAQSRRPWHRRPPAGSRGQLPRPARGLPAARDRVRGDHGRPRRLGRRHPRPTPPGRRRRRRTPPPPPRSALLTAPLGRTRTPHRKPAGRTHPGRGTAAGRDGPVDQGPGRRPPHVRREARRPAKPDDPRRGSPLR